MAVSIPTRLRKAIVTSYELGVQRREDILKALQSVEKGASVSVYREKLAELMSDYPSQKREEVLDFMFSVSNLTDSRRDAQVIARDFATVIRESNSENATSMTEKDFEEFEDFISSVLDSQDSIGVRAKAARVRMQHERVFRYAETYSDIRSIFPQDGPTTPPGAAVIIHSLKVDFLHNGAAEELFLAMDYQDLEELKSVTERAIEKHKTLSEIIENFGLTHVKFGGDE